MRRFWVILKTVLDTHTYTHRERERRRPSAKNMIFGFRGPHNV